MQYRFIPLLALVCALLVSAPGRAQDVLMAKGNAQITLSVSPVNFYQYGMNSSLKRIEDNFRRFDYSLNFSKPLSITAEYAVSSYTTVGLNVNYFSYNLSEVREDANGTQTALTKGSHLDLHLRAVRYFSASPARALYLIGEIGMRKRSIQYSGDKEVVAYINTFPETIKDGYSTLSWDYGVGLKRHVVKGLGVSVELTMLSLLGRYGLFYVIQPAGRRSKDQIGW